MRGAPSTGLRAGSGDEAISVSDKDCFATLLRKNAQPVPYPLDSSFRWNDENDKPVIPGEPRETRNPEGTPTETRDRAREKRESKETEPAPPLSGSDLCLYLNSLAFPLCLYPYLCPSSVVSASTLSARRYGRLRMTRLNGRVVKCTLL